MFMKLSGIDWIVKISHYFSLQCHMILEKSFQYDNLVLFFLSYFVKSMRHFN